MTRSRVDRRASGKAKKVTPRKDKHTLLNPDTELRTGEKYLEICLVLLLFGLGIYHSILYFGHQVVPHFDFCCFANLGNQLLSFEMPQSFNRVPLVGIFQVLLGKVIGGSAPDFSGGWLLNSLLHPFNAVLLWLIGRRIVGKAAIWLAVIMIINPWVLQLLTEAIVETTLLCGVLATFYFMFNSPQKSLYKHITNI